MTKVYKRMPVWGLVAFFAIGVTVVSLLPGQSLVAQETEIVGLINETFSECGSCLAACQQGVQCEFQWCVHECAVPLGECVALCTASRFAGFSECQTKLAECLVANRNFTSFRCLTEQLNCTF